MKLEYLPDLTANGKYKGIPSECLVRLYDFDAGQAELFKRAIESFLLSPQLQLEVHTMEFITSVNCSLTFEKGVVNVGMIAKGGAHFVFRMNQEGLNHVVRLIQPFVEEGGGGAYQWLNEQAENDGIDLLFSPGGTW